jgi:hypothetical protein
MGRRGVHTMHRLPPLASPSQVVLASSFRCMPAICEHDIPSHHISRTNRNTLQLLACLSLFSAGLQNNWHRKVTNQFFEIFKLNFVSLAEFGNVKQYCEKFQVLLLSIEIILMHFDYLLQKSELDYLITWNQYNITRNKKSSALLLTIRTEVCLVEQSCHILEKGTYILQGKQMHDSHTELSFMMIDNKMIVDSETSLNFVTLWWIFLLKQKLLLATDSVTRCNNKR